MYQAKFRRDLDRESYQGADDEFLRSLELVMTIDRARDEDISRLEELTLRTSQMNATGVHYSDATLRGLVGDPDHEVLVIGLTDRYGPHGAVGVLLLSRHERVWHLKLLATSCRVVSFGAGTVILNWITDQAARAGVHLAADFRATERNRMMEVAYRFGGFADEDCECLSALRAGGTADTDGLAHLHLRPERSAAPTTLRLDAIALSETAHPHAEAVPA
jgi:methoxymalonate biosynthesis protein